MEIKQKIKEVATKYYDETFNEDVSYEKAVEYAKFIHREEYDDPIFAPDVEQTIRDFQSGFVTAMRIDNDR